MIDVRRRERLGALLRHEIASVIEIRMSDPRVGFVSVTSVQVAADLGTAKVFVSVYGDDDATTAALTTLQGAASFIRSEVAKRVRLRQMPALRFVQDDSLRRGAVVDRLLHEWHEEAPPGPSE
ncbi:MAG: 30S ribosome-binding factor RbfA [Candidatus Eisenbacteria bacterium]|jgi:ribosome-binding factor A|nr:30S ribosome-binding factor RbfA [Candidatus Eisenbacteria bacterium]